MPERSAGARPRTPTEGTRGYLRLVFVVHISGPYLCLCWVCVCVILRVVCLFRAPRLGFGTFGPGLRLQGLGL